jgi:HK97 family phage major capsid protein
MFVQLLKEWKGKSAGEMIDLPEEFAALLLDQKVAAACDDPTPALVARAAEQAAGRLAQNLDGAINRALAQFADAQSQSRRHAVPAIFGDGASATDRDPRKNFGDWLLHVARQDDNYLEKTYGSLRTKAAMGDSSGVTGGYLVPPEFYAKLLALVAEEAVLRPRAFVQPMAAATLMFPFLDVTTVQSAGTSPFFGGVVMNWTEEAQNRTETEPQFKQMELKAHELSGYAVSSNVLLQDAGFGLEKFLMTLFAKAIAWHEDYAFLQGNGVGKPLGILNAKAALSVTRNAGGAVKFVDVATMLSKLLPSSLNRAVWIIHPYVLAQLVQLSDAGGRIIWVPNSGGAQRKVPGTLFGLDVVTTEKVPALGTKGDVMLVDPTMYVVGDRMQVEVAASEHVNFLKNQMTWRVVERVDGQPWLDNVITLQDAASTVSPFVVLN